MKLERESTLQTVSIEAVSFEEVHNAKSVLHPGSHVRHPEVVPLGVSFGVQVHPKYQLVIVFTASGSGG